MKIDSLPLPAPLRTKYAALGITELYPPQAECVDAGLFERKNLLAAIPTASGKTLVAEMAMRKEIADGGKCLYIVPLKALASEKYEDFSGKEVKVGIATGESDQRDEYLGHYDIIVATPEKTDSLLRNRSAWLKQVSLLVVDEIHLIGDPSRGATLEMVIAKLRCQNPHLQIIGLSATIGNPEELAKWLDATLITSEWRPVDLREGVYYNGAIHFHGAERIVPTPKKDDDLNLLLDTTTEGGQCLVFVSSRRSAESYAKRAAAVLKKKSAELDAYSERIAKADPTPSGKILANAVRNGAAFHHAGLPRPAREEVEKGFRKGEIQVIASTPTLAAGLNLPARRVIIRNCQRYEVGVGMSPISVAEYRQMAGRAGRPRLDPYGEAVLIAKDRDAVDRLFEEFIDAPAENISSQCQKENELRNHLLALVTAGFASNRAELNRFMEKSFYSIQKTAHRRLDQNVGKALSYLIKNGMITEEAGGNLRGTTLGILASRLYLDTETASLLQTTLEQQEDFSAFGMLHLLCMTPDMFRFYLKASDEQMVEEVLAERGKELWCEELSEEFFAAMKTALIAEAWCGEMPEDMICESFGVGVGDIHAVVENLRWLVHAAVRIAHEVAPKFNVSVRDLEIQIENGVKAELLPLIIFRGIGRVRARRLFDHGITTLEELIAANRSEVVSILGNALAKNVLEQAAKKIGKTVEFVDIPTDEEKLHASDRGVQRYMAIDSLCQVATGQSSRQSCKRSACSVACQRVPLPCNLINHSVTMQHNSAAVLKKMVKEQKTLLDFRE
ncbi:MAG: ATP-dependent DNA helicase [Methanocalculaceae archaeon]|jgi:helicase|nr:ATP-dependent DNA helicase [Methanocalculaceae archaeon]